MPISLDFEENQNLNGGFYYQDVPILSKEIALEYLQTGDGESLIRFLLSRTGAHKTEFAGAEVYQENSEPPHPLFKTIPDLKVVIRVKLKFAARIFARKVLRGELPLPPDFKLEAFADYFNEHS